MNFLKDKDTDVIKKSLKTKCRECEGSGEVPQKVDGIWTLVPCPKCAEIKPEIDAKSAEILNAQPGAIIPYDLDNPPSCSCGDNCTCKQKKADVDSKFPINYILVDMAKEIHTLGEVMDFGRIKYPKRDGWKDVPLADIQDAIARHSHAYATGEKTDPESGLSHLSHLAVNCLMAIYKEKENTNET